MVLSRVPNLSSVETVCLNNQPTDIKIEGSQHSAMTHNYQPYEIRVHSAGRF